MQSKTGKFEDEDEKYAQAADNSRDCRAKWPRRKMTGSVNTQAQRMRSMISNFSDATGLGKIVTKLSLNLFTGASVSCW